MLIFFKLIWNKILNKDLFINLDNIFVLVKFINLFVLFYCLYIKYNIV